MRELKELAYILTKHKVRSIEIIGSDDMQHDSKLYKLYEAVQQKKVETDLDAAEFIYGKREVSAKYRNLKHNLKNRLLNTIFFIENNDSDRKKAHYNCWKQWSACVILKEKSAEHTATKLAEKIIKQAIEHEFADIVVAVSLYLRFYHGLRTKSRKKFEHYNAIYHQYKEIEDYQNLVHEYYIKLVMDYALESVTVNAKIKEEGEKFYAELAPMKDKIPTIKFHHYLYQIQLLTTMGVFNYRKAKEVCTEALQFLQNNKTPFYSGIRIFLLNKMTCHIQLKEYEEGKKTAKECEELLEEGAFNWFKAKEFFFMLSMHTANYQDAYYTYKDVIPHPRFRNYKAIFQETWLLNQMYLHFLFLIGEIKPYEDDNKFNTIRLGKFLNQVPNFSKDKHGMNIPILIIQMAFLIFQKKYDYAIDRIEALEKYCFRYLKKNNPNFRCNCFIQMLLQIPISGFHRSGAERRALKYFNKMKTVEINFNNQAHELEIIPFEMMWEFILASLQNKFHKVNRPNYQK